jgi:hypothetical protein
MARTLVRQDFGRAAETLHEALEVEVTTGEVEFDAGRRGRIALGQRDPPARHQQAA